MTTMINEKLKLKVERHKERQWTKMKIRTHSMFGKKRAKGYGQLGPREIGNDGEPLSFRLWVFPN